MCTECREWNSRSSSHVTGTLLSSCTVECRAGHETAPFSLCHSFPAFRSEHLSTHMDVPKDTMTAVFQAVLGPEFNDPELHQKAGLLAQVADVLNCDPRAATTGFLNQLLDLNADILSQSEKQRATERQQMKSQELDQAKSDLKKQISMSASSLSVAELARLKKKVEDLNKKFRAAYATSKAAEKQLSDMGYTENISDVGISKWMTREADLQQEVSQLETQVGQFEGVEASNAGFRAAIADMRLRIENIGFVYDTDA